MPPTPARPAPDPDAVLQRVLQDLAVDHRQVAPGEWGLTLDCCGWPLHVGLAMRAGLLRAQAEAVGPGRLDPALLLHRNRLTDLARYSQSRAGAVWVQAELPLVAVGEQELDRMLGRVVECATWAREAARTDG